MHIFSLCHIFTGFGINTNIFETNILNLIVVIAFVFVNVGKTFTELLNTRRERVLKTIMLAEQKYKEAQAELLEAKQNYAKAQFKVIVIHSEGRILLEQLAIILLKKAREKQVKLLKIEHKRMLLLKKQVFFNIQKNFLKSIFDQVTIKLLEFF